MATEKRLIDANRLEKLLRNHRTTYLFKEDILAAIANQPTVDAVEVVHGRWMREGRFKACSVCGSYIDWDDTLGANYWKFCPYCGAKMDGSMNDKS